MELSGGIGCDGEPARLAGNPAAQVYQLFPQAETVRDWLTRTCVELVSASVNLKKITDA